MGTIHWEPQVYDVAVIGGGHAGIEAALAASRLGARVLLLTVNLDRVGHMACNCSVGGPGKSHLVREIDALGGQMGRSADATLTHIRMLNIRKGPAVQSTRAQADKRAYETAMKTALEQAPGLELRQGEVAEIATNDEGVEGIITCTGIGFRAPAVILATGTFLRGRVFIGHECFPLGRAGEPSAEGLSHSLVGLGIELGRLKTGTVPRIHRASIDDEPCDLQPADTTGLRFSFLTARPRRQGLLPCLLTWTNARTHEIVREALPRSALYGGLIDGAGPRYCPSIESKLVRFPDKERHQVFLEQEGWRTAEVYVWGLSSSLPEDVQREVLHSIAGLERAQIMRPGYAVEYDYADPRQLDHSLQSRRLPGLFMAGQINGTSGYEEAGAQGLMAGLNAVRWLRGEKPVVVRRDQGYIGVLIDDIVCRGVTEPYRVMTSRAEFRLRLRESNADLRLTPLGRKLGLVDDRRWRSFARRRRQVEDEVSALHEHVVRADGTAEAWAESLGTAPLRGPTSAAKLLERPEVSYGAVQALCGTDGVPPEVSREVESQVKYRGYLDIEAQRAERVRTMEDARIPQNLDFSGIHGLKTEARENLSRQRPLTLGQAARMPGVTAADIAILSICLRAGGRGGPDDSSS